MEQMEQQIENLRITNLLKQEEELNQRISFLKEQIDAVFEDIYPDAVKIGMVSSSELISVIAERLKFYNAKNIVVDPVMVATSGSELMKTDAVQTLIEELLPVATLVTPNIPEAEVLSGKKIHNKQGNDLSDNQIYPIQLAKHGTVCILKNQIRQQTVYTHQNIFALIGKGRHFIALFPDQIVDYRQNQHFQQGFRYPQDTLCIFVCAAT